MGQPSPKSRKRASACVEPFEPRLFFDALPTAITLTHDIPVITPWQSVTFTATVTTPTDPLAPKPTGTVAFVEPLAVVGPNYIPYSDARTLQYIDPDTHQPASAYLLGTAPLGPDGTATFSPYPIVAGDLASFTGRFRAIYLGADPAFALAPAVTEIHPAPGETFGPPSTNNVTAASYLVFPDNHALKVRSGQFTVLTDVSGSVQLLDPAASASLLDSNGQDLSWYLGPSSSPLLVSSSISPTGYSRSYSVSVIPLPVFAPYADASYRSSISPISRLPDDYPTALKVLTSTHTPTFTNPPVYAVSIWTAGFTTRLGYNTPPVPARGSVGVAGANINADATGTVSGSAAPSGAAVIDTTFPDPTKYIPPFQPPGPFISGTLSFYDKDTLLSTLPVDYSGHATFAIEPRSLTLGQHWIRIEYSGDENFNPAQFISEPFTIGHTPTVISLSPSSTATLPGQMISLGATVATATPDLVTPTGTVAFSDAHGLLATVPLNESRYLALDLPFGTHTITATYSGDADCLPSSITQTFTLTLYQSPPVVPPHDPIIVTPLPPHEPPVYPSPPARTVDLVLASLTPLNTFVYTGGTIDVQAGITFTGAFSDSVAGVSLFLSVDDIAGNTDDIPVGSFTRDGWLSTGSDLIEFNGQLTRRPDFTIVFDGIPVGTYRLLAIADPDNAIPESNETNNTVFASETITVAASSLEVSLGTPRARLKAGSDTRFSLNLTNRSSKAVGYRYAVKYYFSPDPYLSDDDTPFATKSLSVALAPGQTRGFPLPYKIPAFIPFSTGYVLAVGDRAGGSTDGAPHIRAATQTLQFTGPRLVSSVVSVKSAGRASFSRVTIRLLSNGTTAFDGPVTVKLADARTPAKSLAELTRRLKLKPGKSVDLTFTVRRNSAAPFLATVA